MSRCRTGGAAPPVMDFTRFVPTRSQLAECSITVLAGHLPPSFTSFAPLRSLEFFHDLSRLPPFSLMASTWALWASKSSLEACFTRVASMLRPPVPCSRTLLASVPSSGLRKSRIGSHEGLRALPNPSHCAASSDAGAVTGRPCWASPVLSFQMPPLRADELALKDVYPLGVSG